MTRAKLLIGTFVAVFAVGVLPARAQRTGAGSATREPTSGGERTGGSAVSRGGDSGPSSAGSPSSSGPSSASTSSGDSGSRSAPSAPSSMGSAPSRGEYHSAPSHPSERQYTRQQRGEGGDDRRPSGSATNSGGRAVPRGAEGAPTGDTSRGVSASNGSSNDAPSRRAVPAYSRPRDGRTQTGTAVDREYGNYYPIYGGGGGYNGYYGSPWYYRVPYRAYYVPAYGFGLGYFYDPLWYDPFTYGYGGYGGYGGYYGGGTGSYYGGSGQTSYDKAPSGAVRLKIKPREAQVYVDGFFVGDIDSFDGVFQKLGIDAGGHKIEVRADGYEPIQFDVLVTPGETVTYKGELKRK